ncbi:unnamed protein product [Pseudo-nitzschia multistriata]|uniref:Prolyl 4-hydroxylase alpha subunit domain-containing protein n=1 Tax=Pseudo-nitzschia multistriata TaxID=183589 RepID=A0A448ZIY4_9STRA|nr:unnamed protein product [Pseudo-nitzschia multistriata]
MANKKRKNAQKKATVASSGRSSRQSSKPGGSDCGKGERSSHHQTQRSFQSFPLHLVPNNEYAGKDNARELRELCRGRVWVVPSFFSHKECRAWVDFCESFGNAGGNGFQYTAHPASKYITNRECYRMQQENASELSDRIFQRLKGMTITPNKNCGNGKGDANSSKPKETNACPTILSRIQNDTADLYPPPKSYGPIGCNPNLRVYRYDEGHAFGRHVDETNAVCGGATEMTMLVYLSACRGGATRFHIGSGRRSSFLAFEPEVGALLLHVHGKHCLEHEADAVLAGQKYVLRTDLVYGRR